MAYVSIEEAARLTGKSTQSLYRHVKQGKVSKNHDGFDTGLGLFQVHQFALT